MTFRNRIGMVLVISTALTAVTGGIGLYFALRLIATFNAVTSEPSPLLDHIDDLAGFADRVLELAATAESRDISSGVSLQRELDTALANLSVLKSRLERQTDNAEVLRQLERFVAEEELYGHRITDVVHATIGEARAARARADALQRANTLRAGVDTALHDYAIGSAKTPSGRSEVSLAGREAAWKLLVVEGLLRSATGQDEIERARGLVPSALPEISPEVDLALTAWRESIVGTGGLADAASNQIEARQLADRLESLLQQETGALVRSLKSAAVVGTALSSTRRSSFLLRATPFVLVLAFLVAVILSVTFGLAIIRKLARRVDALDHATAALSAGNYAVRVDLEGEDEFGRLARSFNHMADEVTELNERLEERVKRRTKALIASREQIREQERQLIQADKMATLGILVSGLAHEVNNPNQAIRMSGALLARCWPDVQRALDAQFAESPEALVGGLEYTEFRSTASEAITSVIECASRINAIVVSLKDYVRQDPIGVRSPVNMSVVVKSALTLVENLIRESTDHCVVRLDSSIPPVAGNERQIEQVVINVIQNACQALPDRERSITIETAFDSNEDSVLFRVSDTGVGIDEDALPRVADPFFTTKRARGGTGLGLAIASRIVTDHGGSLDIVSARGVGTTVSVKLPVDAGRNS